MAPYHIQRHCPPYCKLLICTLVDHKINVRPQLRTWRTSLGLTYRVQYTNPLFFSHTSDYNKQAKGCNTV